MLTNAVVLTSPGHLAVQSLSIAEPGDEDVVVDIAFSGISTGTERLLYTGKMPAFPGMGYPLVPGYESVGRVRIAGEKAGIEAGQLVFVPGANCYGEVRGLFGGTASRVVTRGARVVPVPESLGESGILLALAATAQHAIALPGIELPDLIVGHGTVGRLLARLTIAAGGNPVVWEVNTARADGACGYTVINPADDTGRNYRCIIDASGNAGLLDMLIGKLAPGGAVVLAGFYDTLTFAFPPAFMREARILIAAQFLPTDIAHVLALIDAGKLSLDGLITHRQAADTAQDAYRTAFADIACLKMSLDWREFV
jgi:3-hydroxyethyl bacteriochlorophyllide a dehydrogenase